MIALVAHVHSDHVHVSIADAKQRARDPTQTAGIRRAWRTDFNRRWKQVENATREMLVERDGFGLTSTNFGLGSDGRVRQFQQWFDAVLGHHVLGFNQGAWIGPYLQRAADAAVRRAVRLARVDVPPPIHAGALVDAATAEVQGVMEAVSQQAVRAFADGLLMRRPARAIAIVIVERIRKVGNERSHSLADFAVVRAHANATLDVFEARGVMRVDLMPEFKPVVRIGDAAPYRLRTNTKRPVRSGRRRREIERTERRLERSPLVGVLTAGDDDVCPRCEEIAEDGPYTINEARGLIPAHNRCRCGFIPHEADEFGDAFNPDQPRHPAGTEQGGQWSGHGTSEGSAAAPSMVGREDEVLSNARAAAEKLGFDPDKILISNEDKEFELGGQRYKYAGSANLQDGTITLFPRALVPGTTIPVTAHEVMHQKWEAVFNKFRAERDASAAASSKADWKGEASPQRPDGSLREQFNKDYPIYARLQPSLDGSDASKLYRDDGVSDYSRKWWDEWKVGKAQTQFAVHETLAEMARLHLETNEIPGTGRWKRLYKATVALYPRTKK